MSLVLGLQASELAISTQTVWARCPNGDIARRYGITEKNPAGDYWKKIPGNVSCLTGAFFDGLSGINANCSRDSVNSVFEWWCMKAILICLAFVLAESQV